MFFKYTVYTYSYIFKKFGNNYTRNRFLETQTQKTGRPFKKYLKIYI